MLIAILSLQLVMLIVGAVIIKEVYGLKHFITEYSTKNSETIGEIAKVFRVLTQTHKEEKKLHENLLKEILDIKSQVDFMRDALADAHKDDEEKYSNLYEQYNELHFMLESISSDIDQTWGLLNDMLDEGYFEEDEDEEEESEDDQEPRLEHIVVDIPGPIYGQMEIDEVEDDATS